MTKFTAPVLMLLGGLGLAGTASAQCTFDATVTGAGPFTSPSTSTCGKNLSFTPFCGGGNNIAGTGDIGTADPSGVSIFQVQVGTSNTGVTWGVTSSTAGFFPEMALISGSCAAGNACLIDDTNGTQTIAPIKAGSTVAPTPPAGNAVDPIAAGTYYLIVSSLIGGTTVACGSFVFTVSATLPVKLEKFSVD
jgi:hypothetical protein